MAEGRRKSTREPRNRGTSGSLLDYVYLVRRHWLLAGSVFVLTIVGALAWVLFDTPVYESFATIRIEDGARGNTMLGELADFDKPSSLEAEMAVMTSQSLAKRAALDTAAHATSVIFEEHGYRPFNVLSRSLRDEAGPTVLSLRCDTPIEDSESYRITVSKDGKTLTVERRGASGTTQEVRGFVVGTMFAAFDRHLTIDVIEGEMAGRRFLVELRSPAVAAAWIRQGTFVNEVSERTGIVALGFRAQTPRLARRISDALSQAYLDAAREKQQAHLIDTVKFLEEESAGLEKKLTEVQTERDAFIQHEGAHQLAGAALDTRAQLLQVRARRAERRRARTAQQWELDAWRRNTSLDDKLVLLASDTTDPMTQSVATDYADLQRQLKILLAPGPRREKPESPRAQALQTRLDAAREQLSDRLSIVATARIAQIQRAVADIDAELSELDLRTKEFASELARIPAVETKLADFARKIEAKKDLFQTLAARLLEARVAQRSSRPSQHAVDSAFLPGGRKSPRLFRTTLLGVAIGLILALAAAILRDMSNQAVSSPREVEAELGLQIYATIPHFRRIGRKHRKRIRNGLVMLEAPSSVVAEAYRTLRANIRFSEDDRVIQTLAITSATQSEGKSVTTINLAMAMAKGGAKVLVIDADLRRSNVHVQMGIPRAPGLVDILADNKPWQDIVRKSGVERLDLITAGAKTTEPGALLGASEFRTLMDELKTVYDHILIDVPPVLAVADAASFFRWLDGVVLLVRDQVCPLETARGALQQVERLGGKVLGAIYNAYDPRRSSDRSYGYYGYYGHGSGYGGYEATDE